jgi:hypothetical protein
MEFVRNPEREIYQKFETEIVENLRKCRILGKLFKLEGRCTANGITLRLQSKNCSYCLHASIYIACGW